MDSVKLGKQPAVFVTVQYNGLVLGWSLKRADISVVGSKVWKQLGSPFLHKRIKLTAYRGYSLRVLGAICVSVKLKGV